MSKKVLVIDDDPEVGKLVEAILRSMDLTVLQAYSGTEGLQRSYDLRPDLIVLDVMMPGMDGFDVCSRLREITAAPILMLTARNSDMDVVRGFNAGVDDFVKKPFKGGELGARVRALLRRAEENSKASSAPSQTYSDPILNIDLVSRSVSLLGKSLNLSPREYELLVCLLRRQGNVVSHRELLREVWGDSYIDDISMVSLYVFYLRNKLEDGRHGHQYIHTQRGRGYRFEPNSNS